MPSNTLTSQAADRYRARVAAEAIQAALFAVEAIIDSTLDPQVRAQVDPIYRDLGYDHGRMMAVLARLTP